MKNTETLTQTKGKTYLLPEEVARLEKAATNCRDQLLVRLLFRLGCRVSEALFLEVRDIDLEAGTVTIQHLKVRSKLRCPQCGFRLGKCHTYCPGCGVAVKDVTAIEWEFRRIRTLPLDDDTLAMLMDYIGRGGPVSQEGKMLIFGINRHRAWQIVKECAERADLKNLVNPETGRVHNVSPHRLRDSFAINAVKTDDSGDGLRMLQEHLGHVSFNTTARYRKVAGHELRKWYDQLWDGKKGPDGA